jgi:hypothetical protein
MEMAIFLFQDMQILLKPSMNLTHLVYY